MRFIDNGDGTITDTTTGLMWEKEGSKEPMTFERTKKRIRLVKLNMIKRIEGNLGWRLPTAPELEEAKKLFEPKEYYWHYWHTDFKALSEESKYYARCVRTLTDIEKLEITENEYGEKEAKEWVDKEKEEMKYMNATPGEIEKIKEMKIQKKEEMIPNIQHIGEGPEWEKEYTKAEFEKYMGIRDN